MLTDVQAYYVTFFICLFQLALTAAASIEKRRKQSCLIEKNKIEIK